ncbi:hypothetical protein AQUCO_00700175v1 [Aquilegia coerulea]|uniref:Organ-specific protein S2 n=1 Tax=Aquilegia coerulea TaxID=218851 RepID=A0A2G5EJA0_AQUCA|nr:hypothetical protein AQUCO_00700175v1 [Aquilegia coerulea]
MESLYGFFALFSLLLFVTTINARTAPEEYWIQVMKDQPMPEALKGLVNSNPSESVSKDKIKTDCHTSLNTQENKHLPNDVLADPGSLTAFYGDVKPKENEDTIDNKHLAMNFLADASITVFYGHAATENEEKAFVKDFEPRPNVSVYHDEEDKSFVKDFEPRPNVSVYHDGELKDQKKAFADDFEPRPNASVYHDGELKDQKKAFADDLEPRPNLSVYHD